MGGGGWKMGVSVFVATKMLIAGVIRGSLMTTTWMCCMFSQMVSVGNEVTRSRPSWGGSSNVVSHFVNESAVRLFIALSQYLYCVVATFIVLLISYVELL